MKKILITAPYMIREMDKVRKLFEGEDVFIDFAKVEERLDEPELLQIIKDYHGIICGDDKITKNVLEKAKNLQVIVKWGTGIDSIDKNEAERKGIPVFRTTNAFSEPVADTTLGFILGFARAIFLSDRLMKSDIWDKPQAYCLSEKVIGIIGLGNVGTAVATRLNVFNTVILANDIVKKNPKTIKKYGINMVHKKEIYEKADFISLHCDLNKTSYHVLDATAFGLMKKKPFIINTARGSLIEENALIEGLKTERIAGAALDVFENEPLPKESPLRKMKNTVLSSHNSNSSPYHWQKVHENSVKMLIKGLNVV